VKGFVALLELYDSVGIN